MAQRSGHAADGFKGEAVARAAIAFHFHRLKADAVGCRLMAGGALKRAPGAEPPRHLCHAPSGRQMQAVRKDEAVAVGYARGPADAGERWAEALSFRRSGRDQRPELRMRSAEIARVRHPCVGQPAIHVGMTIGAETLRRSGHRTRALMLGMTIDTAPGGAVKGSGDAQLGGAESVGLSARPAEAVRRGMVVRVVMTGDTGGIPNRDERLDMAGLAIAGEAVMGATQWPARPALIGVKIVGSFREAA